MTNVFYDKTNENRKQCRAVSSGGAEVPGPLFEIGAPLFHVWLPGCYIHSIMYFKNVAPLLVFGPSFWFLAPLLLNPGDGPEAVT